MQILTWAGDSAFPHPSVMPPVAMVTAIYIYIFFQLITGTSTATVFASGCFRSSEHRLEHYPPTASSPQQQILHITPSPHSCSPQPHTPKSLSTGAAHPTVLPLQPLPPAPGEAQGPAQLSTCALSEGQRAGSPHRLQTPQIPFHPPIFLLT